VAEVLPSFERDCVKATSLDRRLHPNLPSVRLDAQGLSLDGKLVLPREEVTSVSLILEERTTVAIRAAKGRGFHCTFTDPADAEAMLEALGRAPGRTVLEVPLEPSLLSAGFEMLSWWKAVGVLAVATIALFALLPFIMRPSYGISDFHSILERTLELGADGVRIRGRLSNGFLRYREIRDARERGDAVVLTLQDGRECVLPVKVPARLAEIVARIRASLEGTSGVDEDDVSGVLREAPGTKTETISALRVLGRENDELYRGKNRVPRERLWNLVEDPRVNGATRARAAIALSGALTGEERQRLRVAVESTVSPHLRVALDGVETESDERLAERLDALPDDDAQETRRAAKEA
jgi:hypothetical protein